MKRDGRGVDALSIFGVALAGVLPILGPGTGFYVIAMGWP